MICNHCGREVPDAKKTCPHCGEYLWGWTFNNVTGEYGYRNKDGLFIPILSTGKEQTKRERVGRWIKRNFTRIAWILTAAGVGTWVFLDITRLIRVALALMIWVAVLAIGLITVELFNYLRDRTE